MAPNNPQLHHVVVFNNKGFRNPATYATYLNRFRDRPIYPSLSIQSSTFNKYDMDLPFLIRNLGWESMFEHQRFSHCPEAVRLFYVNIKRGRGVEPSLFTTKVFNHEITITPALLASFLSLPHSGHQTGFNGEFEDLGFDYHMALNVFTRDTGRHYPNMLSAGRLPNDLKVFHFFITRCFLPRDLSSAEFLHPSDLWIISNAKAGKRISYASLVFAHMLCFGDGSYNGKLPFGPIITRLLHRLGIDLRDKVTVCDVLDDICPNHILNHLDMDVGRRKPVAGSGGRRGPFYVKPLHAGQCLGRCGSSGSGEGNQ
ncbi:unnamed protein product [Linum tenue]|uniref:Putative plant transposon protein domain-containing protein n=2 Tax=Linum tenue TaxID=586396 RepID=A0AAV0KJH8_9ROSI|nr:unnamed protein product [Linum tenue]